MGWPSSSKRRIAAAEQGCGRDSDVAPLGQQQRLGPVEPRGDAGVVGAVGDGRRGRRWMVASASSSSPMATSPVARSLCQRSTDGSATPWAASSVRMRRSVSTPPRASPERRLGLAERVQVAAEIDGVALLLGGAACPARRTPAARAMVPPASSATAPLYQAGPGLRPASWATRIARPAKSSASRQRPGAGRHLGEAAQHLDQLLAAAALDQREHAEQVRPGLLEPVVEDGEAGREVARA